MTQTQTNTCVHCNKPFSCGCQKIAGLDGKLVHKTCKPAYDVKTINKK